MLEQRLKQYFFVIAAVTAILEGAFPPQSTTQAIKYALLIISGLVVGSLVKEDQSTILIFASSYAIATYLLTKFLTVNSFFKGIINMMQSFAIFVIILIIVVSLEQFVNKATNAAIPSRPKKQLKKKPKKIKAKKNLHSEHWWGIVVLIAVGFTFVILIAEFFFQLSPKLTAIFFVMDLIITTIFIMDLIILYEKTETKKEFVKKYFFDIISAIPFAGVFQAVKIVRAIRIVKAMKISKAVEVSKAMKLTESTKLLRANQTTKFMSEGSEFNELLDEKSSRPKKSKRSTKKQKKSSRKNKK